MGIFLFFSGFDISLLRSQDINAAKILIEKMGLYKYFLLSQMFSILLPAIFYLFVFHGKNIKEYIKLKLPSQKSFFLYSAMLLFLAYPLIQFSYEINRRLPIANWFKDQNELIDNMLKEVMHISGFTDFLIKLFLVALLPAVGEELFFRAGIQNELTNNMKNKDLGIILTALLFSFLHFQFDGFLPRFFLGLILGYIYFWSQSIWVSATVHFINNALIVIAAYLQQDQIDNIVNEQNMEKIPLHILLMSIIAVFVLRNKMLNMWKADNMPVEQDGGGNDDGEIV